MKQKLKCILLIDDCEATNFYNQIVINKLDIANSVVVVQSGMEGLEYLRNTTPDKGCFPDVIFLDINMPGMNGWEFLEEYDKLNNLNQAHVVLLMLTTSLNPDDQAKAKELDKVNGFVNKPLQSENLQELLGTYF